MQKLETGSTQQAKGRLLIGTTAIASRRRRILSIFLLLFFLITVGGFIFINRPGNGLNSSSDSDADKSGIAAKGSAVQSDLIKKEIPETAEQQQTRSTQAVLKPKKSTQLNPLNQDIQTTGAQATRSLLPAGSGGKARQAVSADPGQPGIEDKEKNESVTLTAEKLPAHQVDETSTAPDIPMIDPSILKLQAISWSPEAKDRLAVINNRILREKGSVEGYVIILIDQDSVVVEKGVKKGRLIF